MKKYLFITLLLLSSSVSIFAAGVKLLCRPTLDSIMLRWAPTNKQVWDLGNKYGYMVERYTILRDGKLVQPVERNVLSTSPLRPQPLERWEPYQEDKYVSIAAECVFGSSVNVSLLSPSAIAKRYQEEQNRFSFALYAADQSPTVARLSALAMTDRNARSNEKYLYRVFIAQPDTFPALDTALAFTGMAEYQPLPAPLEFRASWSNRRVQLSWNTLYQSRIYSSYVVEKSTDSLHFAPLSDNANVSLSAPDVALHYAYTADSLSDNQTTYYYRLRGINAFGELGPPCRFVAGHGRLPITHPPVIENYEVLNNEQVQIVWSYPEEMNAYIKGFSLYRASHPTGLRQRIHTDTLRSTRNFVDLSPEANSYYSISVFDEERELSSEVPAYVELLDSTPPAPPTGLKGVVDTLGMVYLSWKSSTERDLDGYRVYRANHPRAEFSLVSPAVVHDTTFTDKINIKTLTRQVYYKLRAVDLRQNQSSLSELLTLERPDVVPPVAPRLQSIEEKNGGLTLAWVNSSSSDVARHHVYRKENTDTAFTLIASIDKTTELQSSYTDKTAAAGHTYRYYVLAEDRGGLRSPVSATMTKAVNAVTVAESLVLKVQANSGKAKLQWTAKSSKKVARIIIYRSVDESPLQMYNSTTEAVFVDEHLSLEKKYSYRIRATYDDESLSGLSNTVEVKM